MHERYERSLFTPAGLKTFRLQPSIDNTSILKVFHFISEPVTAFWFLVLVEVSWNKPTGRGHRLNYSSLIFYFMLFYFMLINILIILQSVLIFLRPTSIFFNMLKVFGRCLSENSLKNNWIPALSPCHPWCVVRGDHTSWADWEDVPRFSWLQTPIDKLGYLYKHLEDWE